MKKSNPTIKAQIVRSAFYLLLLLSICAIPFALAQRNFNSRATPATSSKQTQRTLSFADRVAYQRAIECVWRHRILARKPESGPKPPAGENHVAGAARSKGEESVATPSFFAPILAPADHTEHTAGAGLAAALLNTGGRYNPSTDSWTATSTTNAPAARSVTRRSGPAVK